MERGDSGRDLTIGEFRQLIRQLDGGRGLDKKSLGRGRRTLNDDVLARVGLRSVDGAIVGTDGGAPVALEAAHAAIQRDREARDALYQLAMDLWR